MPNEKVTINLILTKSERAKVDIRSDISMGVESMLFETNIKASKINVASSKIVFSSTLLTILIGLFSFIYLRYLQKKGLFDRMSNPNNAGFLLLHSGLTEEATQIFSLAIMKGRFDQLTLSNFALCHAVKGDIGKAKALLKAASFIKRVGHTRAVVLFNEALIHLLNNDKDKTLSLLRQAIKLSPSAIKQYCQKSVLLDGVRVEPAFYDLFKDT